MENQNPDYTYQNVIQIGDADASRKFMASVFAWMFVALGISSAFAYAFSNTSLVTLVLQQAPNGGIQPTGLGFISMICPLAFVLIMSFGINRISYSVLSILYILYSAITGVSLTIILISYTPGSIVGVFLTTSALFGIMALAGYTTKTDLTKFGSLMIIGLFGIIIASIINFFLRSPGLDYLISYIGVAVFVGLTAYDVQKLKNIGAGIQYGEASAKKMALMGGLTLYLDFINLFLFLLRIFGRRR
jgi:uncharacterized protein